MFAAWSRSRRADRRRILASIAAAVDEQGVSAFGPAPIPPTPGVLPGAIQASFVAQQAQAARPRDKTKPQDADPRRTAVRDEVKLSDPLEPQAVDIKPDAAEEWKHQRRGQQHPRDPRFQPAAPRRADDDGEHTLDLKA